MLPFPLPLPRRMAPAPSGGRYHICQFCSQVVNVAAPYCLLGVEPGARSNHVWCDDCQSDQAKAGVIGHVRRYIASYARWWDVRLAALYAQARYTLHAEQMAARRLRRAAH